VPLTPPRDQKAVEKCNQGEHKWTDGKKEEHIDKIADNRKSGDETVGSYFNYIIIMDLFSIQAGLKGCANYSRRPFGTVDTYW